MEVLVAMLIAGCIFWLAFLMDDNSDDDDQGPGKLQPVYVNRG